MREKNLIEKPFRKKTWQKNSLISSGAGINKIIFLMSILTLITFSFACLAEAAVIGVNKGVVHYRNVLKNGYAQELLTLTTDTDFNLSITYRFEGEIAEWARMEPGQQPFFISRNNPAILSIIIEPPEDAMNRQYAGSVRFLTGALAGPEGQFGTAVRAAVNTRLSVDITGQEIVSCSVGGIVLDDSEEGFPFEFYAVVSNNGNVRIRPDFVLEFWNQDQSRLVETFSFTINKSILPTVQERVFYSLPHSLSIGQYWVRISSPICGSSGSGFLTASVIERGGVSDQGELIRIDHSPWAKTGDIIPIDAVFKNLGSRIVSAKFKGVISSGDNIFKIIDTDSLDVAPGQSVSLRTYFNPVQDGQYMIKGQVLYNRKLTFEKSSVLNVNPGGKPDDEKGISSGFLLSLLLIAVIVLLFMLVIRKKKRITRLRRQRHFPRHD